MKRKTYTAFALLLFALACNPSRHARSDDDTVEVLANELTVYPTQSVDLIKDYRPSATRNWDLLHTRLDVSFDLQKQYMFGHAVLECKPYRTAQNNIVLDAKGMEIQNVVLHRNDTTLRPDTDELFYTMRKDTQTFEYSNDKLSIPLPYSYERSDRLTLEINYIAKPNERTVTQNVAIDEDRGLYFIDPLGNDSTRPTQIWTQGEVQANSVWFPTIDEPNEKCTQEIFITVPDSLTTLSNGALVSSVKKNDGTRTDYWKQNLPHSTYLFMMAIGKFAVVKDNWNGKEISYLVEPEYEKYARQIFGKTPRMIQYFSALLDFPYPWEKYAQVSVRDYVSGAMENTSASLFFSGMQRTNRELIDRNYEDIIAHELAHQWFGDLVTAESWSNLPLNESFATYCEYLWQEHEEGKTAADYGLYQNMQLYLQEAQDKQEDMVRFYYKDPNELFDRHSYEKGACILHMLREYLGGDVFFDGIRLYLKQNAYKTAEMHQLRLAMEEVSGEDLNWFFNQWFYANGHPVLKIDYDYNTETDTATVIVTQKHSNDEKLIYRLPSKIALYLPGGKTEWYNCELDNEVNVFRYYSAQEPVLIDFDPGKTLLCERIDNKTIPYTEQQYFLSHSIVAQLQSVRFFAENQNNHSAEKVLNAAIKDPFPTIRKTVVENLDLTKAENEDLLERIKKMAQSDSSAVVRAACIKALAQLSVQTDFKNIYAQSAYDSSYKVAATALIALTDVDSAQSMRIAAEYALNANSDISDAVATVYAANGDKSYAAYFEKRINDASPGKYNLMYHYANFLGRMGLSEIEPGIGSLKKFALNFETHWLAAGANGALKRLRTAMENRKKTATAKMKSIPGYDLSAMRQVEEEVKLCEQAEAEINNALKEVADAKTDFMKNG